MEEGQSAAFCVEVVGERVILDSRLAIVSRDGGWMAVADVHYGYEVSRRATGGLFPLWGVSEVEERVDALLESHQPDRLIFLGDIVDSRAGDQIAAKWLNRLGACCDVVCIRGNHDPGDDDHGIEYVDWHREDGFVFHHGHLELEELEPAPSEMGDIEVIGHLHPSISFGDGMGTLLRLPALVQDELPDGSFAERWVLPAFSPWAGGGRVEASSKARYFGCGAGRIIRR